MFDQRVDLRGFSAGSFAGLSTLHSIVEDPKCGDEWEARGNCLSSATYRLFFLLHAAKVRSSCEEGPGQSALQSAYHNPKLDVTELKQNRTP